MNHPNDMTREELREVVSAMSWLALDLAQHLDFTIHALKREYLPEAMKRAMDMAREISSYPYSDDRINPNARVSITVLDGRGATTERWGEVAGAADVLADEFWERMDSSLEKQE